MTMSELREESMKSKLLTFQQMRILRHALGVNPQRHDPWRDHYYPGQEDLEACRQLAALGFMETRPVAFVDGPMYFVTKAGDDYVRKYWDDE